MLPFSDVGLELVGEGVLEVQEFVVVGVPRVRRRVGTIVGWGSSLCQVAS